MASFHILKEQNISDDNYESYYPFCHIVFIFFHTTSFQYYMESKVSRNISKHEQKRMLMSLSIVKVEFFPLVQFHRHSKTGRKYCLCAFHAIFSGIKSVLLK